MDFELSSEQRALQSAARELLDARATTELVRKAEGFDPELWREMCAQGWPAVVVPEDLGGLGLGFVEVAVLAEEVGRHLAPAPFVSSALAADVLARSGASARPLLDRLLDGGVGAVGWGAELIVDAPVADVLILAGDAEVVAYDLSSNRPAGATVMDLTRTVSRRDQLSLGSGIRLGGAELADALLDRGATALAAELLGAAGRMLEVTVGYAGVREQFGRPIGSFQAVKHRCADMYVDVEGMRSAAYYAAWAVAAGAPDAGLAASTAKSWCSDAATRVMASALQVHGGIGFTWEHDLHLYLKRAQLSARQFGTAGFHRERIIRLLAERRATGQALF